MEYGISSYVWVSPFRNSDEAVLQKAKDFGFDIFEAAVETVGSFDPHVVKDIADKIGIKVYICGCFGATRDPGSENPEIRKEAIAYLKTCIDYAVVTGSPYVSGPMYATSGVAMLRTPDEKEAMMKRIVESLKDVGEYAEKRGVKLAIEPLNRYETDVVNTVDDGLALIERIGGGPFGFLLDMFHMSIEEKSFVKAIEKAGERLYDFHACANDRGTPGEDHFDWVSVAGELKKIGYKGPVVIESFTSGIKEIAKSASLWHPVAPSMDYLASNGLKFLKGILEK